MSVLHGRATGTSHSTRPSCDGHLHDAFGKEPPMSTIHTERIPVMSTGQALLSLRSAGYSLPAAIGEVIDNSLEAEANEIGIRLDEAEVNGKKRVHRLAFSDDGTGMDPNILQHYLQIGFSTRFMHTDTIGKFGVGAKLAALNYGTRIDVWSRTDEN